MLWRGKSLVEIMRKRDRPYYPHDLRKKANALIQLGREQLYVCEVGEFPGSVVHIQLLSSFHHQGSNTRYDCRNSKNGKAPRKPDSAREDNASEKRTNNGPDATSAHGPSHACCPHFRLINFGRHGIHAHKASLNPKAYQPKEDQHPNRTAEKPKDQHQHGGEDQKGKNRFLQTKLRGEIALTDNSKKCSEVEDGPSCWAVIFMEGRFYSKVRKFQCKKELLICHKKV